VSASSIIKVVVTGDVKGLHRATEEAVKDVQKTGHESSKVGKQIAGGFAIAGGAALAFGVQAVEAADVADKAHVRLETAIKNTGGTWEKYGKQIKSATDQGQQFGYDEGQIEGVLASMTTGLGSTQAALDKLPLAQNIAAATGKDLASAGLLVVKVSEGQSRALKQLGIDLPVAAGGAEKVIKAQQSLTTAELAVSQVEAKIKDGRLKGKPATDALATANNTLHIAQFNLNQAQAAGVQITDALTKRYAGAASAEADTFAGRVAAQAAAWRNVKIEAGQAIENGLIKFQTWSQKSGRPEILRLQGDLHALGVGFSHLGDFAVKPLDTITDKLANLDSKLTGFGGDLSDAFANVFGGGTGQGTPGAAQRDRARLDAQNRAKTRARRGQKKSGSSAPAQHRAAGGDVAPYTEYTVGEHGSETLVMGAMGGSIIPHGAGRGGGGNVYATINVHSADPTAVTNAIAKHARRNGVRV
jgi:hypothetical protein